MKFSNKMSLDEIFKPKKRLLALKQLRARSQTQVSKPPLKLLRKFVLLNSELCGFLRKLET